MRNRLGARGPLSERIQNDSVGFDSWAPAALHVSTSLEGFGHYWSFAYSRTGVKSLACSLSASFEVVEFGSPRASCLLLSCARRYLALNSRDLTIEI